MTRPPIRIALALAVLASLPALVTPPATAQQAPTGTPCRTAGTWVPGELNVYFLDVEQGDAQLVVGPTGRTMLIDLGENVWNRTQGTNAQRVAGAIRAICGVPTGPVHLDHVMGSHLHLDHIGYAGNPHDTTAYGNGIWELLHPDRLGFTVGTLIDRDGGRFVDSNGDGDCEIGTAADPSPDVRFTNAGTVSQTARRWICWLHGPAGQRDRLHIQGRVLTLTNDLAQWPAFDMGPGVQAQVLQANAKGVMQADGVTPVSGDHTAAPIPPSENDYSIAIRFSYGEYQYATAGDTDGVYATSGFGYSYNDVERTLAGAVGDVDTMRVNHHGSSKSSSPHYVNTLAPETAVISCGANTYGHPAANVLTNLAQVVTSNGVGADVFMTNNPCDANVGTVPGAFNRNGDIHLSTTGGGAGYRIAYDTGTRSYTATPTSSPAPGTGTTAGRVTIAEARFRGPGGAGDEFVELRNVGGASVDVSGWRLQGCASTDGSASNRATIPAGTTLAPGQHLLLAHTGYVGAVVPDIRYSAGIADGGGARILDATGVVVDGMGSASTATSQCREGRGLTMPTTNTDQSMVRGGGGATDTGDNAADFSLVSPSTPQNLASPTG